MTQADTDLVAYALGTIGIRTLPGQAGSGAAQVGADTAQAFDDLALLKGMLLAVDAKRPDLGIAAELLRLGDLVAARDLDGFANGFGALVALAKPHFDA